MNLTVSMLSLPFELQEQILNYLGHQDLLSLAQTCRSLNFVASARLRAIIPKLNFSTFTRCIHVLIANPVRAAEILELNIANYEFNAESLEPRPPPSRGSSFITSLKAAMLRSHPPAVSSIEHRTLPCNPPPLGPHHLSQAFTNMTRLRKLVIHTPQSPILWMAPVVVGTLREIYAHDRAESSPMLGWISYQPHINTLRIHCNGNKLRKYRVSPPNSIFFPSLSLLTTNPGGASILLPESVVEDLHIENLGYHNGLLERLEGVERPQDPSLIQAIRESHERTPLRRLTLTGNASDIFKFLNSLAEGGVALPHIRIAPCCGIAQSFQTLVRLMC